MTASASFTYATDKVENPLSEPFEPGKRWTCWSSGKREDWYAVEFATTRTLSGFNVHFFDDAPSGGCRPPDSFEVQYFDGRFHSWNPVKLIKTFPERPREGENRVRFERVESARFRLMFRHAGSRFYTGLYGLKPIEAAKDGSPRTSSPLQFTGDKFITADDILVSVIRVHNPTDRVQTIYVDPIIQPATTLARYEIGSVSGLLNLNGEEVSAREPRFLSLIGRQVLHEEPVDFRFRYAVLDDPPTAWKLGFTHSARGSPFLGFAKPFADRGSDLFKIVWPPHPAGKDQGFQGGTRAANRQGSLEPGFRPQGH